MNTRKTTSPWISHHQISILKISIISLLHLSMNTRKMTSPLMSHHQISFLKHLLALTLVCFSLVLSINSLQMSSNLSMNLKSLFCHIICCFASSCWHRHDSQITNMVWGTSVYNLKRNLASRSIDHIAVSKIDLRQGSYLILLLVQRTQRNMLPKV